MRKLIVVHMLLLICSCMPQLEPPLSSLDEEQAASTADGGGSASTASDGGSTSSDSGDASDGADDVPKVRPSWLVISEVLYDIPGTDSNGDSFIELAGEAGTEISDYQIALVNGSDGRVYDTIKMPEGSFIPDDTVFVIADAITGSPGTSNVETADHVINFDPQNGPDAVQLLDDAGNLVDAVGYGSPITTPAQNGQISYEGSPAEDVGSGMSLARVDSFDTDDNSLDFIELEAPSPGILELPAQ